MSVIQYKLLHSHHLTFLTLGRVRAFCKPTLVTLIKILVNGYKNTLRKVNMLKFLKEKVKIANSLNKKVFDPHSLQVVIGLRQILCMTQKVKADYSQNVRWSRNQV